MKRLFKSFSLEIGSTISSIWTFTRRRPISVDVEVRGAPLVEATDDRRTGEPTTFPFFSVLSLSLSRSFVCKNETWVFLLCDSDFIWFDDRRQTEQHHGLLAFDIVDEKLKKGMKIETKMSRKEMRHFDMCYLLAISHADCPIKQDWWWQ